MFAIRTATSFARCIFPVDRRLRHRLDQQLIPFVCPISSGWRRGPLFEHSAGRFCFPKPESRSSSNVLLRRGGRRARPAAHFSITGSLSTRSRCPQGKLRHPALGPFVPRFPTNWSVVDRMNEWPPSKWSHLISKRQLRGVTCLADTGCGDACVDGSPLARDVLYCACWS